MNAKINNPCTRCGKERIISKTWKEEVDTFFGKSVITHTETVCPDPECQKIVEEKLEAQRQKTEELQAAKEERMKRAQLARKKAQG